jgi:hypothetical protein
VEDNENRLDARGSETGATGLEPATSGVTGRARGATSLHGTTRKSLNSRVFGSAAGARPHALACPCPHVPPHPDPIASSSIESSVVKRRRRDCRCPAARARVVDRCATPRTSRGMSRAIRWCRSDPARRFESGWLELTGRLSNLPDPVREVLGA